MVVMREGKGNAGDGTDADVFRNSCIWVYGVDALAELDRAFENVMLRCMCSGGMGPSARREKRERH